METSSIAYRMRCPLLIAGVLTAAAAASGCDDAEPRGDRAATAVVVSAAVLDDAIALSPRTVGAGPIRLVVSNQAKRTRELVLATAGGGGGIRQRTGPINPSDTASLSADLQPGSYTITSRSKNRTVTASLTVGTPRPPSNDIVLTP